MLMALIRDFLLVDLSVTRTRVWDKKSQTQIKRSLDNEIRSVGQYAFILDNDTIEGLLFQGSKRKIEQIRGKVTIWQER